MTRLVIVNITRENKGSMLFIQLKKEKPRQFSYHKKNVNGVLISFFMPAAGLKVIDYQSYRFHLSCDFCIIFVALIYFFFPLEPGSTINLLLLKQTRSQLLLHIVCFLFVFFFFSRQLRQIRQEV